MPSDLQVDNIKDGSATKTLAEYSSSAWSWGSGVPAGSVLQVQHFQTQETNGLDASWTNLYENSITLKSASSDIHVLISGNFQIANNQGFGFRIYRDNSATVTDSDTAVWDLNQADSSSNPYTVYTGGISQRNDTFTIFGKDTLSGFSVGNTLYYALLCKIFDNSGSAVQVPGDGAGSDGFFTMQLMEIQK